MCSSVRSGTVTLYIVRQVCTSRSYACCVHGRAARPGGARCMHSDALVSGNDVSPAGSCSSRTDLGARSYYPCRSSSLRACSYDRTYTCLRSRFDSGCNVACCMYGLGGTNDACISSFLSEPEPNESFISFTVSQHRDRALYLRYMHTRYQLRVMVMHACLAS